MMNDDFLEWLKTFADRTTDKGGNVSINVINGDNVNTKNIYYTNSTSRPVGGDIPEAEVVGEECSQSAVQDTDTRGRSKALLFADDSIAQQEAGRVIGYIKEQKLLGTPWHASKDNAIMQVVLCFVKRWRELKLVDSKCGAAAIINFFHPILTKDCRITLSAESKTISNSIGNLLKDLDQNITPYTYESVRAKFPA